MNKINNVFVVDDDKIFHFIIRKLLTRKNIAVNLSFYENGHEALEGLKGRLACRETFPDLILLDINMPILDGWQFLEEYQQLAIHFVQPPKIYLVSSSNNAVDTDKALEFGNVVTNYLLKPIDNEAIDTIFSMDHHKKSLSI